MNNSLLTWAGLRGGKGAFRLLVLVSFCYPGSTQAEDWIPRFLTLLEGEQIEQAQTLLAQAVTPEVSADARAEMSGLFAFYTGDYEHALHDLRKVTAPFDAKQHRLRLLYLEGLLPWTTQMEEAESDHFRLRTPSADRFLAPYALDALEKSYQEIGKDLRHFPKGKVLVEIYGSQEAFAHASTLGLETLERSGAIGICKYNRLMLASPKTLPFGFRWLDALAHEYAHYIVTQLSLYRCPLWLQEGIAHYFETRWRPLRGQTLTSGSDPSAAGLTPYEQAALTKALKENRLVTFSQMEPSLVYLKDSEQVSLAFSEVTHAVRYFLKSFGPHQLNQLLRVYGEEKDPGVVFQQVVGSPMESFEERWRSSLKELPENPWPGASPDWPRYRAPRDEVAAFVGPSSAGYIRLGDRMRLLGRDTVAILEYEKALQEEPYNPVALTKLARTYVRLQETRKAEEALRKATAANPHYEPAYHLLAELDYSQERYAEATHHFLEANAINPYNPILHKRMARIAQAMGQTDTAIREAQVVLTLEPGNLEMVQVLEQLQRAKP